MEGERECDELEEKVCELHTQIEKLKLAASQTQLSVGPPPLPKPPSPDHPLPSPLDQSLDAGTVTPAGQAAGEDAAHEKARLSISLGGAISDPLNNSRSRMINPELGIKVAPIAIPSVPSSRSAASDDGLLTDQFVVVKQLTSEFQAERMRDLQMIAQLQDELSDCHLVISKLQEQERALKATIREVEDR